MYGRLHILEAGSTWPFVAESFGDFDVWIRDARGDVNVDICVLDVEYSTPLLSAAGCAGIDGTGRIRSSPTNQHGAPQSSDSSPAGRRRPGHLLRSLPPDLKY
jgi:hypothetical protein